MLKIKFSKKCITSILFLLAALFIALFLGSYKFLSIENLDTMDPAPAPMMASPPAASPSSDAMVSSPTASSPVASSSPAKSSPLTTEDINKLLGNNSTASS